MKKSFLLLLLINYSFVFSQVINIPDVNFKTKLLLANVDNPIAGYIKIDINNNNQIEESEALLVTNLNLFNSNISSVEGLQYFTNILYLGLHFNSLSNINLNSLTQLVNLKCNANNLSSINLTGLTSLEQLDISSNYINSLDFSGLSSLKILKCDFNQFTVLDFSQNAMLSSLYCKNNNLISINLKNGINQDFSNVNFNDCWKTGNPNLVAICVDASELASVQNHLNNCGTAQTINITSNCGLGSEEFVANKVVLYPNPTNNFVTLHNEEGFFTTVVIYNYLGQELKRLSVIDEIVEINLSNFNNGIYFFNLLGEKNEVLKILKQ